MLKPKLRLLAMLKGFIICIRDKSHLGTTEFMFLKIGVDFSIMTNDTNPQGLLGKIKSYRRSYPNISRLS